MSCRILIVPEDPTYDEAILKPLIKRMASACGRANAKVIVLTNPSLKGIDDLREKIEEVVGRYAYMDAVICIVDADGKDRTGMFAAIQARTKEIGERILCCAAQQEVEAWLLAGHTDKLSEPWGKIQANTSVKEEIFQPFLQQYGDPKRPFGGRDVLMKQALEKYDGILARCPELQQLQKELCILLAKAV